MVQKRLDHDQILVQSRGIILQDGISALTFPRLAKDLGVRSQSLYNYFKNKDDVIAQLGAQFLDALYQQVIEGLVGLTGKAAFAKYAQIAHDYFEGQGKMVELIYYIHNYGEDSAFYQAMGKVLDLLDTLVSSVQLKTMSAEAYVQTLISSVLGFTVLEIMGFLPADSALRHTQFQEMLQLQLSEIVVDAS